MGSVVCVMCDPCRRARIYFDTKESKEWKEKERRKEQRREKTMLKENRKKKKEKEKRANDFKRWSKRQSGMMNEDGNQYFLLLKLERKIYHYAQ